MSTVVVFAPEVESVLALKSTRSPEALQRLQAAMREAGRDDAEFTAERLRELVALVEHFHALLLYDQADFLRAASPGEADREYALGVQRAHLEAANGFQRFLRAREAWAAADTPDELTRVVGLAIDAIHGLMKWGLFVGEPTRGAPWRQLHALYALADADGNARVPMVLYGSQPSFQPTAQALYLRTLVLDLLNSGSLSGVQSEIADGWFSSWCQEYTLDAEYVPGRHHFYVDLDAASGMRVLRHEPQGGKLRYLRADGIKQQIEEVQAGLRNGRLFAGYGAGALFPVEEHVAMLATIEKLYQSVLSGNDARVEERTHFEDREVDVVCGAERVIRKVREGMRARPAATVAASDLAQTIELSPSGLSLVPAEPSSTEAAGGEADPELDRWRVHDLSSRGYGLIVEHAAAEVVPVTGLIALANHETGGWILGSVVRKRPSRVRGEVLAGVEVLAYRPIAVELLAGAEPIAALYLPGADTTGKHDSLVVLSAHFDSGKGFALRTPEGEFKLRLNRIIRKGADWINARFEIESKKA